MVRGGGDTTGPREWLASLIRVVGQRPIVIFRFDEDEWSSLRFSRRGTSEFTIARAHSALEKIRVPTACFLIGRESSGETPIHFGLLRSKSPITTLQSRLKISDASLVRPSSEAALLGIVSERNLSRIFRKRLDLAGDVIRLSPVLSVHLVERLAEDTENQPVMQAVSAGLDAPKRYSDNFSVQEDAVTLSLKAFGLSAGENAILVDAVEGKETALAHIKILEDAVIEHDARVVPGFTLSDSDLTGRAVFKKGNEILEIITANKRPLEEVLGIDLIYLNSVKQNVVMVQYKMLNPRSANGETDWIYHPDEQFYREMERMRRFGASHKPGTWEYRINPQVFYLRFVRRDATLGKSAVTMPVDHFDILREDPACKGPKGAFRISYEALGGRYLRQDAFLDLIQAGYIGAYAQTTGDLSTLINAILSGGRSVVAAVQSSPQ